MCIAALRAAPTHKSNIDPYCESLQHAMPCRAAPRHQPARDQPARDHPYTIKSTIQMMPLQHRKIPHTHSQTYSSMLEHEQHSQQRIAFLCVYIVFSLATLCKDPKLNYTEMPQVQSEDEQGQDPTTLKCPTPKTRPTKPNLNNQEMSKSKIKATNTRK